ncbi:MAG: glycine cleavage system protein GcvH [Anaerolineales bacterium]|nr:MAG: glycine cleavage system protein GcvH [Anaerolineales bacterium]
MQFPKDLKYTESDEWVRLEGDTATAGITDYAQDQLSDVVYVEAIAEVGQDLAKGEIHSTVESVKAAADVYLPIGGTIIEVNEALADSPELVNSDPFGAAWMVKFKVSDAAELDGLMDAAAYEKRCEEREH